MTKDWVRAGSAVPVQCLGGCGKDVRDVAGQIYGEVLIFTNVLTDVQRQRIERYLSKKWGIPLVGGAVAAEMPASIDVVPGTSVEIEDDETRYLKRTIANDTRPLAVDTLFSKFSGTTQSTYADTTAFLHG